MPHTDDRDAYQAWLVGEALLLGLLGASLALFLAHPSVPSTYALPELRLVLQTVVMLAATLVAVLAAIRFSVEGRRSDLLLACGFSVVSASTLAFAVTPVLGGQPIHRAEGWTAIAGRLVGWALIAAAPFVSGKSDRRRRSLQEALALGALALGSLWVLARFAEATLPLLVPASSQNPPSLLTAAVGLQALLNLVALAGFGLRFRNDRADLDRWLALGATLALFASLHLVFTPLLASRYVSWSDFLGVLAYAVLLVGVWRAIRFAEFGRAVAEERARVARDIHDGLAQYLFAISTHTSMLAAGAPLANALPQLQAAATSAQQEARFAVLALSSASGTAPFDAALRRYVEFLTADGALDVDLELDPAVRLAPDEQIEVFRIVQEGLGNVRKHARARHAEVVIGERAGKRFVLISDDGEGFEGEVEPSGQGLKNIRARTATIAGDFRLRTQPGRGTALEVLLRT